MKVYKFLIGTLINLIQMKLKFSSDVKQIPQYSTLKPLILYLEADAAQRLPFSAPACSPYSIPPLWQLALGYFAGPTLHKFRRSLRRLFLLSKTGFIKFQRNFSDFLQKLTIFQRSLMT